MENKQTKATNVVTQTVQVLPDAKDALGTASGLILNMASYNDDIPAWGSDIQARDAKLQEFWKTEDFLASTITSIAMTRSSLQWELSGPPKTVDQIQKVLNRSDFGRGWTGFISKIVISLLSADNGAFIEIVRGKTQEGRKPESAPVIALNNLQSSRCTRTGDPITPVIYQDDDGAYHKMKWYQVIALSEVPIPSEDNTNLQYCFVSRVLNFAQTMKAINNFNKEKITGRFTQSIHVVSGVSNLDIENIEAKAQLDANNKGLLNYGAPLILSTLDPSSTVSHAEVQLASLPSGFDFGEMIHTYILLLSLGSGLSYTDLSPLTGGSLGSSSQVNTIQENARVKSLLLFMKNIENALKNSRVIPPNVTFAFSNSNGDIEQRDAEIKYRRAQTRKTMIEDGTITPAIARQVAVDEGDLSPAMLALMGQADQATIVVTDSERVSESDVSGIKPMEDDTALEQPDKPEPVTLDVAEEAAKWFTKLIVNNPINAVVPIPSSQTKTFHIALRNMIRKESLFGTDSAWMDDIVIDACRESGIDTQALRYRLPDNYKLLVTKDSIIDSEGQIIYVKEYKKDTKPNVSLILEDITVDNFMRKLDIILGLTNSTVDESYVKELNRLKYFNDIELLKVKLIGTYYKNLSI